VAEEEVASFQYSYLEEEVEEGVVVIKKSSEKIREEVAEGVGASPQRYFGLKSLIAPEENFQLGRRA